MQYNKELYCSFISNENICIRAHTGEWWSAASRAVRKTVALKAKPPIVFRRYWKTSYQRALAPAWLGLRPSQSQTVRGAARTAFPHSTSLCSRASVSIPTKFGRLVRKSNIWCDFLFRFFVVCGQYWIVGKRQQRNKVGIGWNEIIWIIATQVSWITKRLVKVRKTLVCWLMPIKNVASKGGYCDFSLWKSV